MKIKRNGMEIELTADEMIDAWMEVDRWHKIEDLENAMPEDIPAVKKRELALKAYPLYEKAFSWSSDCYANMSFALKEVGVDF